MPIYAQMIEAGRRDVSIFNRPESPPARTWAPTRETLWRPFLQAPG